VNLRAGSELVFALGRRYPRLPLAFLRAPQLPLLRARRAAALRETFGIATRAAWYRDAFAATRIDVIDLEVVFAAPGTLRTGRKLLRLVDERLTGPLAWATGAIHGAGLGWKTVLST
jgi:hypothetical protein